MMRHIIGATMALAGVVTAAISAQAASTGNDALPPFATGYEPTNVDERGLWMLTDERERQLRDSPLRLRDEALHQYLRHVLCRTVGADRCRGVRIYIMEVPGFNASMYPNGMMILWTGMLLRAQNEAELAAVLGHEFAHFELRHSLSGFKQQRAASDVAAWATIWGGLANIDTRNLQLSLLGSIYRFSRGQEQAADLLGFKYLAAANYPTNAASALWRHLMAEDDATAIGHGQKPKQGYNNGFFSTHPTSLKRATYLTAESQKIGDSGRDPRAGALSAAIAPHLPHWLDNQLRRNDFGGNEFLLQQRALIEGWTSALLFARGELYRLRGRPRDLVSSAQFYRDALAAGYAQPQLHRNLGLALMRSGEQSQAITALNEYLRLSPDASDRKIIMTLIGQ